MMKSTFGRLQIKFLGAIVASAFLFQNCGSPAAYQSSSNEQEELSTIAGPQTTPADLGQKASCRFIGGAALGSLLQNVLGLPQPDVAMVNQDGNLLVSRACKTFNPSATGRECFYIAEHVTDLQTERCDASTFRLVAQIAINACHQAVQDAGNVRRLFPNGSADVTPLYTAFTGRAPRIDERQVLTELAQEFSGETEKMAAVCAAIGSSLAAINSF